MPTVTAKTPTERASFSDILADVPAEEQPTPEEKRRRNGRKDLRPILVLGFIIVYSITVVVGSVTLVVVTGSGNDVAQKCIEAGGEWRVSPEGERQCVREAQPTPSPSRR